MAPLVSCSIIFPVTGVLSALIHVTTGGIVRPSTTSTLQVSVYIRLSMARGDPLKVTTGVGRAGENEKRNFFVTVT